MGNKEGLGGNRKTLAESEPLNKERSNFCTNLPTPLNRPGRPAAAECDRLCLCLDVARAQDFSGGLFGEWTSDP